LHDVITGVWSNYLYEHRAGCAVGIPLVTFIAPIAGKLTEFTLRQITGQKPEKPFGR